MAINSRSMHTVAIYGEDLIGLLQPMADRPPMAINSRSMHTVAMYRENLCGIQPKPMFQHWRVIDRGPIIVGKNVPVHHAHRHLVFVVEVGWLVRPARFP
jgi:hypothetical protein